MWSAKGKWFNKFISSVNPLNLNHYLAMNLKLFLHATCILLLTAQPLAAQLAVEIIEDVRVGPEQTKAEVEAPETRDHSQPRVGLESDQLHFLNRDRIQGSLQSVDVEEGLTWAHPDAKSNIVFALDSIGQVLFKGEGKGNEDLRNYPRIVLTNGDQYRGRIVGMNVDQLVLDTPMAGRIELATAMIESIRPRSVSTAIYEGPTSQDEWEFNRSGSDRWTYRDGAMYAGNHNQVMGKHLDEFPDFVRLEFRLEWKGNVNFQVGFWGQDPKNTSQNCYTVSIQSGIIRASRNYSAVGRTNIGTSQLQTLSQVSEIDVTLLLNRPAKEILLFVGDEMVSRWNDNFDGEIVGNAINFGGMGNTPTKLSRISVREWDGEFVKDTGESPQPMDRLLTVNGDSFMGTLEKIEADVLHFANDFASFQVPMDRVSEIGFSKENREIPRLQQGDVKIEFGNKEQITLRLHHLKRGELTGDSEASGEIKLNADYLSRLQFNPYDERHQEEEHTW
jgi:hypothetical protein